MEKYTLGGGALEEWDVYDRAGRPTGERIGPGKRPGEGFYQLAAEAWIFNPRGELLVQQRGPDCATLPGVWGMTTGKVRAGEGSREGLCREIEEELGLLVRPQELAFMARIFREDGTRFVWDVYTLLRDAPVEALRLQPEEVADARWLSARELAEWLCSGKLYVYPEIVDMLSTAQRIHGFLPLGGGK